jgi:hypothetical protein
MGVSGPTRSVLDRYSIKLHEQTRAALRKTTEYVRNLGTEPKVVPLSSHQKYTSERYGRQRYGKQLTVHTMVLAECRPV